MTNCRAHSSGEHSGWIRWRGNFFRGQGGDEGGAFEQAAEIFLAGVLVRAVGELEGGGGFVADFEPCEVDDAHEFSAALPDLALLKFHGGKTSLLILTSREMATQTLLFLAGGLFGGCGRAFLGGGAGGFGVFLAGFFLVRFRGFISHSYFFH
jgi:hypothetical protein